MKRSLLLALLMTASIAFSGIFLSACNKPILYGKDKDFDPIEKAYSAGTSDTFQVAKEVLKKMDYKIEQEDPTNGTIATGWRSTKSDSHYLELFDREDYGTVGAYYKIKIKITEKNAKSVVEVSAPIKSLITGRMHSSYREEKRILAKMADQLRKPELEMSNVGTSE